MNKLENFKDNYSSLRNKEWPKLWRIPRFILYLIGFISYFWYFWSFIGLIIGVIFCIFSRDKAWKRNGFILSYSIVFITLLIFFFKGFPPLNLAIWTGITILISYLVILIFIEFFKRKTNYLSKLRAKSFYRFTNFSDNSKNILKTTFILLPLFSWSIVSIDLGVMFDNNAQLLWIHAPSTAQIEQPFDITVEAWDSFERLSATYKGTVSFSLRSYNMSTNEILNNSKASLPEDYTFNGQLIGSDMAYGILDGKDNGIHIFNIMINTTGIHYVLVTDSETKNQYYSNPIIVKGFADNESKIYWGDIHTHSHLSDGSGFPDEHFYYAENIACLDFNALTDHGEIMLFTPGSLDFLETSTNKAYKPNDFVTFHGIEWTNVNTGHYVCIFSGDRLLKNPILSYMTVPTTKELWNALEVFTNKTNCKALALPHHTTKKSYIQDWTQINPKYVRIAEVTSVHGECLFEQRDELNYRGAIDPPPSYTHGSSIIDAYSMGYRMTMYAASDEHDGHPGHSLSHTRAYIGHQRPYSIWHTRNEHPYPGGISAIFAENLTRKGIFESLYNGRIFCSSDHGRPILIFNVNGIGVGDSSTVIVENQTSEREINIFLAQDGAPVALKSKSASVTSNWIPNWEGNVEIIKNGMLWKEIPICRAIENISLIDPEPIVGSSFEEFCIEKQGKYYINSYSDNPVDPSILNTQGFDYYLVRIVGDNGRHTYAGPIWVEY